MFIYKVQSLNLDTADLRRITHMKILRNRAKCLLCDEIIESKSIHDYQVCKCGNLKIDGGHEYVRIGVSHGRDSLELMTESVEDEDDAK